MESAKPVVPSIPTKAIATYLNVLSVASGWGLDPVEMLSEMTSSELHVED
jgi:hypothetical protein